MADRYLGNEMQVADNLPPHREAGVASRVPADHAPNRLRLGVITEHIDPRGKPYFWIGEQYFRSNAEDGTDYRAIENGYVSITPLKSDMTDHGALTQIGSWNYLTTAELLNA